MAALPLLAPPKPRLSLCVGLVGPRAIGPADAPAIAARIADILDQLAAICGTLHQTHAACFSDEAPHLTLVCGLNSSLEADAADAAVARGYRLRMVLPVSREAHRTRLAPDAQARMDALSPGSEVWSPPPMPGPPDGAQAAASAALVAQADLLIALQPGEAEVDAVIEAAVRRGVPVMHLPQDGTAEVHVLWADFEGLSPDRLDRLSVPARDLDRKGLEAFVATLIAPPEDSLEVSSMRGYFAERKPGVRWRLEYPLLLAVTGVSLALRRHPAWSERGFQTPELPVSAGNPEGLAALNDAFGWADRVADHAAHNYRGGLVFNYMAAATAVLLALAEILWPQHKAPLIIGGMLVIAALIANTAIGTRMGWHRRWLDYRCLAEQLRPLRTLSALGAAMPARRKIGNLTSPVRWTDWYRRAIWRQMGAPASIPTAEALTDLVDHISDEQIGFQIRYNEASAHRLHLLDHRLHLIGNALFYATVAVGLVALIGLLIDSHWVHDNAKWLTVAAAGLPALGAALFGIRGQTDLIGAAGRSAETARTLRLVTADLDAHRSDLLRSSRAVENAAAAMCHDLTDWRTAYRHRKLVIPA